MARKKTGDATVEGTLNGEPVPRQDLEEFAEAVAEMVDAAAMDAALDDKAAERAEGAAPEDDGGAAARMLARIFESANEGREHRLEYERLNERAKAAKKRLEAWEEEHADLEAELQREYSDPLPLFAKADEPKGTATGDADADAWRDEHIETLGLPAAVEVAVIEAVGGAALGQFSDWLASHAITDLPGVGPAKAEQIENAWSEFWARRDAARAEAEVGTDPSEAEAIEDGPEGEQDAA